MSTAEEIARAWMVMQHAELSPSSDELALLATWEGMRLMLVSDQEAVQARGRDGIRGLLQVTIEALREHDPEGLNRLVEQWRPQAEALGLEW